MASIPSGNIKIYTSVTAIISFITYWFILLRKIKFKKTFKKLNIFYTLFLKKIMNK